MDDQMWAGPSLWDKQLDEGRKARQAQLMTDAGLVPESSAADAYPPAGFVPHNDGLNTNGRRISVNRPPQHLQRQSVDRQSLEETLPGFPPYPWPPRPQAPPNYPGASPRDDAATTTEGHHHHHHHHHQGEHRSSTASAHPDHKSSTQPKPRASAHEFFSQFPAQGQQRASTHRPLPPPTARSSRLPPPAPPRFSPPSGFRSGSPLAPISRPLPPPRFSRQAPVHEKRPTVIAAETKLVNGELVPVSSLVQASESGVLIENRRKSVRATLPPPPRLDPPPPQPSGRTFRESLTDAFFNRTTAEATEALVRSTTLHNANDDASPRRTTVLIHPTEGNGEASQHHQAETRSSHYQHAPARPSLPLGTPFDKMKLIEAAKRRMSLEKGSRDQAPFTHEHPHTHASSLATGQSQHRHSHRHHQETKMEMDLELSNPRRQTSSWSQAAARQDRNSQQGASGGGTTTTVGVKHVHRATFSSPAFVAVDQCASEHIRQIEEVTSNTRAGMHKGYAELGDFLRALKGGLAVHRVNNAGQGRETHLGLTPSLDGIVFHHGPGLQMACTLPFSALRAVAAPFASEAEMGCLRPHSTLFATGESHNFHARTVVLVFAVKSQSSLPKAFTGLTVAEQEASRGKKRRALTCATTAKAAMGVAELILEDPDGKQTAAHEAHVDGTEVQTEHFEIIKVKVPPNVKAGEECLYVLPGGAQIKVTIPLHAHAGQLIPIKVPSDKIHAKALAAAPGTGFIRVGTKHAFYNLAGGLTGLEPLDGKRGSTDTFSLGTEEALRAPRARGYSLGVLVVTLMQMGARDRLLAGLPIAAEFIGQHLSAGRKRRGSVSYGLKKVDLRAARKSTKAKFSGTGSSGRVARILSVLHHLYRPSYDHHSYVSSRFSLGTIAEVSYSLDYDLVCEIVGKRGTKIPPVVTHISLPMPVFKPTMYFRGKLVDFDKMRKWYTVEYTDGPYLSHEAADGKVLFRAPAKLIPKGGHQVWKAMNVHQGHVTVDIYDNFSSHVPYAIVIISLLQAAAFAFWCAFRLKPGEVVTSFAPVAGPGWAFMQISGEFPGCESLQFEWWRLITYQFVHSGIMHVGFNVFIQLMYGLPLNMVHGNIKFGFIYMCGVLAGALSWIKFDGGYTAVVGCSGGVYCIFGMHIAEIVTNWSLNKRGTCNRGNRLFVLCLILGTDLYTFMNARNQAMSYTTHFGGLAYGYLCGIILFDDLERTRFHTHVGKPLAIAAAIALPGFALLDYIFGQFPPKPMFDGAFSKLGPGAGSPCCWQLVRCGLERDGMVGGFAEAFQCTEGGLEVFTVGRYPVLVSTCAEFAAAVNSTDAERFAGH